MVWFSIDFPREYCSKIVVFNSNVEALNQFLEHDSLSKLITEQQKHILFFFQTIEISQKVTRC